MSELLFTAFIMGIMGSVHCISMCGSLTMALGFSVPKDKPFWLYSLLISLARICGYAFIGFIVNLLSQSVLALTGGGVLYLTIFASLLMIGIGLHVANVTNFILKTERIGQVISRYIEPIKKKILPIDSPLKCLGYGFFWGFLPCGMVYTALTLSMTASTSLGASLVMLLFGLGTLPTLVGLTGINAKLNRILERTYVRFMLGSVIIIMAVSQLYLALIKLQQF
jgi:hypothetical protein